jgi:hypothetical protein
MMWNLSNSLGDEFAGWNERIDGLGRSGGIVIGWMRRRTNSATIGILGVEVG